MVESRKTAVHRRKTFISLDVKVRENTPRYLRRQRDVLTASTANLTLCGLPAFNVLNRRCSVYEAQACGCGLVGRSISAGNNLALRKTG